MTLTVLGSGTMMPVPGRYPSGYLLEAAGMVLLLDCSAPTIARLVEHRVNLHTVDLVCLSHFHTDHFGGLLPFIHARWVDDISTGRSHRPLTVLGPKELKKRFRQLRRVFWPEPKESYPVTFLEGPRRLQRGAARIRVFPIRHVPWFPSVGFRVEVGRRSLVYTGDLGAVQEPSFEAAIRRASALLIEAGALAPAPNHYTAGEAVNLAKRCHIPKVLLTHIRQENMPALKRAIRGQTDIATVVRDGDRIAI